MVLVIKIELYSMFPCLIRDKLVGVVVCQIGGVWKWTGIPATCMDS